MVPPTLGDLGLRIRSHWLEHRPRMANALDAERKLDEAVHAAEQLTLAAQARAIQQGMSPDQAHAHVRHWWAFLPNESDVPVLSPDPRMWTPPISADALPSPPRRHLGPGFGKKIAQQLLDNLNANLRREGKIK